MSNSKYIFCPFLMFGYKVNLNISLLLSIKEYIIYAIFSYISEILHVNIKMIATYALTHVQYDNRVYHRKNYTGKKAIYQIHNYRYHN